MAESEGPWAAALRAKRVQWECDVPLDDIISIIDAERLIGQYCYADIKGEDNMIEKRRMLVDHFLTKDEGCIERLDAIVQAQGGFKHLKLDAPPTAALGHQMDREHVEGTDSHDTPLGRNTMLATGQPLEKRVLMDCEKSFYKVVAVMDVYRELCREHVIPQTVADKITKSHSVEEARGYLFDHMRDYGTLATLNKFCDVITSEEYIGFETMREFGREMKKKLQVEAEGRRNENKETEVQALEEQLLEKWLLNDFLFHSEPKVACWDPLHQYWTTKSILGVDVNVAHLYRKEAAVIPGKGADTVEDHVWETVKRSVCLIDTQSNVGKGTGFIAKLVPPFPARECVVLVTNHHVLPSIEAAMRSNVYFDRVDGEGHFVPGSKLFDTAIWKTCQELDYFLIGLHCSVLQTFQGGMPTPVSLQRQEELLVTLAPEDMLYIIHHPGKPQGEELFRRCMNGYPLHKVVGPFLTHKATTYGGSSGAPLFKEVQGELVVVALHCGCVPPTGQPLLNGSFLISHVLHHVLYGTFKEEVPSLEKLLKECSAVSAIGNQDTIQSTAHPPFEAPVSDAATSLPPPQIHSTLDTADIIEALNHQLDAKWRHFGTHLRVEYKIMNVIDRINCGRPEDCMLELLDRWTSKEDGTGTLPRTWQTVIDAVKKSGYGAFAESLALKYK